MRSNGISGICFYLFLMCQTWLVSSQWEKYFYPNDENCGLTEEIDGDPRTLSPWIVAIYTRKNLRSPFEYFLTGTLGSPTTVITAFGGSYGQPPFKSRGKRYYIPRPELYLVVAGLRSTDLNDADKFTQFANVNYVLPCHANSSGNEDYHMAILRLATPMNLTTPYVRTVCQPYSILPELRALGLVGRFSDLVMYSENPEPSFISGFDAPVGVKGPYPLATREVRTSNDALCRNTYKYYYRSEPDEIYCLRILREEGVNNSTCFTHGSMKVWIPTEAFLAVYPSFSPTPRYYSSGPIVLVSRKDRGQCDLNTIYYVHNMQSIIDWLKLNMICSPQTYPCNNGKCIPLNQVCDGKSDCSDGELSEDEDPIYCIATKRCKGPSSYQCGLEGECIDMNKVGDGVNDCPSGSDEDPLVLKNKGSNERTKVTVNTQFCFPLSSSEGVVSVCTHPKLGKVNCFQAPPGTTATLSCAKHYVPLSKYNSIEMKCYDDNKWKPFRSFSCRPECGLPALGKDVQPYIIQGQGVNAAVQFPWHAALFKENSDGIHENFCGASIIERNVLITAAHCTTDEEGKPYDTSVFKIILHSNSSTIKLGEENIAKAFDIEEIRRPASFDAKNLQSDIAVVKLAKTLAYSPTVRPVCYLSKKFIGFPTPNSIGSVPGYGVTEEGKLSPYLKYVNLEVIPPEECGTMPSDKICARSPKVGEGLCYGDSGGGLVFPLNAEDNHTTYLLKGVVSNRKSPKAVQCSVDSSISGFTLLDSHSDWLFSILQNITNSDA